MNHSLDFAIAMELGLCRQIELMLTNSTGELHSILQQMLELQKNFWQFLQQCRQSRTEHAVYPDMDTEAMFGIADSWSKYAATLAESDSKTTEPFILLIMLEAAMDKSAQFYQQAGNNSVYPVDKVFMGSVAQLKGIFRRRIHGLLRVVYNDIWSQVGFAPFLLGRD